MSLFRKLNLITLVAVILLIFVGGFVRSSGAGMGCPDWPTCFGQWIPPLYESQLPANYQELYADHGYATNAFNARKTWTEYVNRLLGVSIGFLIIGTALASFSIRKRFKWVFRLSVLNILLVIGEGLLGAMVVYSNLLPSVITWHMLLALLIMGILIWSHLKTGPEQAKTTMPMHFKTAAIAMLALVTFQILLGTKVREIVDVIMETHNYALRDVWISKIGLMYLIHRSLSWAPLLLSVFGLYLLKDTPDKHPLRQKWIQIFSLIIFEIGFGVMMAYGSMPMLVQPLHLVNAAILFGVCFSLVYDCYGHNKR